MVLHFILLYTPVLQGLFGIVPLDWSEWKAVLWISAPIIGIDECLKWVERNFVIERPTEGKGAKSLKGE